MKTVECRFSNPALYYKRSTLDEILCMLLGEAYGAISLNNVRKSVKSKFKNSGPSVQVAFIRMKLATTFGVISYLHSVSMNCNVIK